ncbi:helicase SNF [Cohnella pontilimi]|uniref:Helicase SNF n=1 Tax=Cohnella pontilimi TaxID=2564100 RepID=A0A4U0FKV0_9BACL|nr:DEAD/DEAH box helicase [Cohnella pontilimi]TJY44192.1 helicase SNF [Cohnella pontilimi]
MSIELTEQTIQSYCGRFAFERGEAYFRDGRVTFTSHYEDDETFRYEALVEGKRTYEVTVRMEPDGQLHANCSCPAFDSYDAYCEHIAAVLLHVRNYQRGGVLPLQPEESGFSFDRELADGLLGLFTDHRPGFSRVRMLADERAKLGAEFTCRAVRYGLNRYMFGIEMKMGPKKLYAVQNIRQLLEHIERGEVHVFSKQFSYIPELHGFERSHEELIRELIRIYRHEQIYRESAGGIRPANRLIGERTLLIPPMAWESLVPLLIRAPSVRTELDTGVFDGIRFSDEPVPLQFAFDQHESGDYTFEVRGLENLTVMEPYGLVLWEGKMSRLASESCSRLSELKRLMELSLTTQVRIPPEQVEPYIAKVLPGLMKLGRVRVADRVSERMLQTPLKAKLFLDRVKDRLLAGLEFQYGDIVINPLEDQGAARGSDRILVRDGEKEHRILEFMERSAFGRTEAGYFMENEEAEFDFLHDTVPQLEKLLTVYATSAVKTRLYVGNPPLTVKVDVDERTDWLEFKFDMTGVAESEIRKLLQTLEDKRKYYRLPSGALLPLQSEQIQRMARFFNEVGVRSADLTGTKIRLPVAQALHLTDSREIGSTVQLGKSFRMLLEHMRNPDHLDYPVPEKLAPVLRDYQAFGFQWLKTLAHYRFGGILADDMGLGKTLQSIAFLVSVLPDIRSRNQPALVVCPSSLMYNWLQEFQKFAPEIKAVIADGTKTERIRMRNGKGQPDVWITSYPLLRRDLDLYAPHLFHTLILDEAQSFKNHATQTAQAVKSIQAVHRFALTGTPVENRLEELWSIYDVVFPSLFPGRAEFHNLPREMVAKRVRPFLLRRVKSDVLQELPEKIESIQSSVLLPEQKKLYAAYLAKLKQETLKHLNEDTLHTNRIKILAGITRLRQLCCHPALFVDGYTGSSAKFEQLMELVDECRSAGKRVLIFSQFTEMLGMIGRELGYLGVPFFYLDGQTPNAERVQLCGRFNEGERDVFLISLKAGGTGLNLTGADTVILYDLWWNPAVEQQAADRAHRIGQTNVVQVIRLVSQGTVEDKMYELQQKKKQLIDEVIQPGQETLSALTEQDIREILAL